MNRAKVRREALLSFSNGLRTPALVHSSDHPVGRRLCRNGSCARSRSRSLQDRLLRRRNDGTLSRRSRRRRDLRRIFPAAGQPHRYSHAVSDIRVMVFEHCEDGIAPRIAIVELHPSYPLRPEFGARAGPRKVFDSRPRSNSLGRNGVLGTLWPGRVRAYVEHALEGGR